MYNGINVDFRVKVTYFQFRETKSIFLGIGKHGGCVDECAGRKLKCE